MKNIMIMFLVFLILPTVALGAISGNPGNLNGLDFYSIENYKSISGVNEINTKILNMKGGNVTNIGNPTSIPKVIVSTDGTNYKAIDQNGTIISYGTNSDTLLSVAVNAASGGILHIMEGKYYWTTSLPENTIIQGEGSKTIIFAPIGTYDHQLSLKSNSEIRNLQINGYLKSVNAIYVYGTDVANFKVTNVFFNHTGSAVTINGKDDVADGLIENGLISNNVLKDCSRLGSVEGNVPGDYEGSRNIIFESNIVYNSTGSELFDFNHCSNVKLINNIFYNENTTYISDEAIDMNGNNPGAVVSGNFIRGCFQRGIRLPQEGSIITDNNIEFIPCVSNPTSNGAISLWNTGLNNDNPRKHTIANNIITNSNIVVDGASYNTITNNIIKNGSITIDRDTYEGVSVPSTGNIISNNIVISKGASGIVLNDGSDDNIIIGNSVKDLQTIPTLGTGIKELTSKNNQFIGNIVQNATTSYTIGSDSIYISNDNMIGFSKIDNSLIDIAINNNLKFNKELYITGLNDGVRNGGQSGDVFNGTQSVSTSSLMIDTSKDFTYEVCFSTFNVSKGNGFIGQFQAGSSNYRPSLYAYTTGKIVFNSRVAGSYYNPISTTTIKDNTDYCVDGVYDGTKMYLYVNGLLEASENAYTLNGSGLPIYIGRGGANLASYSNGHIYKATIWNVALNSSQVRESTSVSVYDPSPITEGIAWQILLNNTEFANTTTIFDTRLYQNLDYKMGVSGGTFTGSIDLSVAPTQCSAVNSFTTFWNGSSQLCTAINETAFTQMQAQNYYSADGTIGYTGDCLNPSNISVKNGLIVGCS